MVLGVPKAGNAMGFQTGIDRSRCPNWHVWPSAMAWAVIAAMCTIEGASGQFCNYEVTAIVPGPDCGIFTNANIDFVALNDFGQACGTVHECAAGPGHWPIIWSEETGLVILPLPDGAIDGDAVDINNVLGADGLGQVACVLTVQLSESDFADRAYLYDDGEWTALGTLGDRPVSRATAINDHTEIVGESLGNGTLRAFRWKNGVMSGVPGLLGPHNPASDVSNSRSITGWMGPAITVGSLGFLKTGQTVEEIPPVAGGFSSLANAVSNFEIVVGESWLPVKDGPVPHRAWIYEDGQALELPNPSNANRTDAIDVNDADQVLVHPDSGNDFLWQDGAIFEIESLEDSVDGLSFTVSAINSRGQVAGDGSLGGTRIGLIISPVGVPMGDVSLDCAVDARDIALVLRAWGPCASEFACPSDLVTRETFQPPGDGRVDAADLAFVLGNWSPTPSIPVSQTRR